MYHDVIIPAGLTPKQVATKLAELLYQVRGWEKPDHDKGPWEKDSGIRSEGFQLDCTNDYWFHVDEDGKGRIGCRYANQNSIVEEAARRLNELSQVRFVTIHCPIYACDGENPVPEDTKPEDITCVKCKTPWWPMELGFVGNERKAIKEFALTHDRQGNQIAVPSK
ncbi:MAG: hypothetical protein AAB780_00810 [Patescibacteria group bacterium]